MSLDKNSRPRFGSDWDLDLGYVIVWALFFFTIVGVFAALSYASVQNNRGNVARDNYYAEHCKVVNYTRQNNDTSTTYHCQGQ